MKAVRNQRDLSKEQLVKLSQGDGQNLIYDLSRMKPRDFIPIMKALKNYAKSHIFNLTFALDYYYQYCQAEYPFLKKSTKAKHKGEQVIPFTLSHSAYYERKDTVSVLVSTLEQILPKSITLFTLNFSSMLFGNAFTRLARAISQAHSLRTLTFVNCDLRDSGFAVLAEALQAPGITSLMCQRCGLTDASVAPLTDLLKFQLMSQRKGEHDMQHGADGTSLAKLDLRDNDFSSKLLASISDFLADLRINLIDIRNNQPIDPKLVIELQKSCPHTEIRVSDDKDGLRRSVSGRVKTLSVGKSLSANRIHLEAPAAKPSTRPGVRVVLEDPDLDGERPMMQVQAEPVVYADHETEEVVPVIMAPPNAEDNQVEHPMTDVSKKEKRQKVGDEIKIADGIRVRGDRARLFVEYLCDVCAMTKELQDKIDAKESKKKRKRGAAKPHKTFKKAKRKTKKTRIPIVSNRRLCPFM